MHGVTVKITVANGGPGTVQGKLADAELHFSEGPLAGLKLIGFAVWERRDGAQNVTFPARSYAVNGERRSFALLRPTGDQNPLQAGDTVRTLVLAAYRDEIERLSQDTTSRPAQVPDGSDP